MTVVMGIPHLLAGHLLFAQPCVRPGWDAKTLWESPALWHVMSTMAVQWTECRCPELPGPLLTPPQVTEWAVLYSVMQWVPEGEPLLGASPKDSG